jgi:hypothetical protein
MANLDDVLQQLREEHKQAQLQVEKLNEAISVIEGHRRMVFAQGERFPLLAEDEWFRPRERDGRR